MEATSAHEELKHINKRLSAMLTVGDIQKQNTKVEETRQTYVKIFQSVLIDDAVCSLISMESGVPSEQIIIITAPS